MITEADLKQAIAECQGERYPSANTCIKLAAYYICLKEQQGELNGSSYLPVPTIEYVSETEFGELVGDKDKTAVMRLMDELMTTLSALHPRLYDGVIRRLKEI